MKYKYIALFAGMILSIPISCKDQKTVQEVPIIQINESDGNIIDSDMFISEIDTLELLTDSNSYISQIQDICINDSNLYILDKTKSIFIFDTKTGVLKNRINRIGRGHNDLTDPKSISVSDSAVYILDFQGRCVLEHDMDLNYKKRTRINFIAMDFAKVNDGFIFYNLNANKELKRIVHTDTNGNILKSFDTSDREIDAVLTDRIFCKSENEHIYISESFSNELLEWKNDSIATAFLFETEGKTSKSVSKTSQLIKSEGIKIQRSFVLSKYVVTQFLTKGIMFSNIYDRETGKSFSGIINTHLNYPFIPMACKDNSLIGVYESEDMKRFVMIRYILSETK